MNTRLNRPLWAADAYPLRKLARIVETLAGKAFRNGHAAPAVDLGCGDSPYERIFSDAGFRYIGCDLAGANAEITIDPGKKIDFPSGSASAVLSFQVLEHVWDLDWYLGEARRILDQDGFLLLSTHGSWLYHPHPGDYRRWTRSGLIQELESRGFSIIETHALVGPLAWTSLFRCLAVNTLLRKIPIIGSVVAAPLSIVWNLWLYAADAITPKQWIEDNAAIYVVLARRDAKE